jgi:uncharacterized membrane protein YfcA
MEVLLGFAIAVAISLTGIGAGTVTTPLLILFLGVSPAAAVGTALAFSGFVKIVSVPFYAARRQVNFKVLRLLLFGGLPGVIAGSFFLDHAQRASRPAAVYFVLGVFIVITALVRLYRVFRPAVNKTPKDRSHLLPWLALPIGAEVGFSSAGAGALGSLLLLGMTPLAAAEVVGTDLCFGLVLSLAGGAIHIGAGNYDLPLLIQLGIGGLFGAFSGSMLATRVNQRPLRIGLLLVLILLGCRLALHP